MLREYFQKKTELMQRAAALQQPKYELPENCKRAVGLFPESTKRKADLRDTVELKFHHLLVSLEAEERTGCLKISSRRTQSRSALLLFRGRVVGAVYGCKKMQGQYLHEDAHRHALNDLAAPGNMFDAYELPEELVLAAASLFYGEKLDINCGQSLDTTFDYALGSVQRSGRPGCVVINSLQDETICIVYVANARIVGVFSAADGWAQSIPESAKRLLRAGNCKMNAAILALADERSLGFSLTGLGDKELPGAAIDATPFQDFSPEPSAMVKTASRKAVAEAMRNHRGTGDWRHVRHLQSYASV